jgi:hypothetical protein
MHGYALALCIMQCVLRAYGTHWERAALLQRLQRQLRFLDKDARDEAAEQYNRLDAEGLFDATLESSHPKLAVASVLHAVGVHFASPWS